MKRFICLLLTTALLLQATAPLRAQENDPVAQCARGVELSFDGNPVAALPLLEAGFAERGKGPFRDSNDLGYCALALGILLSQTSNQDTALEALAAAKRLFSQTGERQLEGLAIHSIGNVYIEQRQYETALLTQKTAFDIFHEVDDQTNEGKTLNAIGLIYYFQGKNTNALSYYKLALTLAHEAKNGQLETTIIHNIGQVYQSQGQYNEAITEFQKGLEISQMLDDMMGEGMAHNLIGQVYYTQGFYAKALARYGEALNIADEVKSEKLEGDILNNMGAVYEAQGLYKEALTEYHKALDIAYILDDMTDQGKSLNNIGRIYYAQGLYKEAAAQYQEAFTIVQTTNDVKSKTRIINNMGTLYKAQGLYKEALTQYTQALEIARKSNDREAQSITINNLGTTYHLQGQYAKALRLFQQALALDRNMGLLVNAAKTIHNIGGVYKEQGQYENALNQYMEALELFLNADDFQSQSITFNNIGGIYFSLGQYTKALANYNKALAIQREINDRAGESRTLNNIGNVHHSQQQFDKALGTYQNALDIQREVGNRVDEGITIGNIGFVFQSQKHYEKALTNYTVALTIARDVGNLISEGTMLNNIGNLYETQEQIPEALHYYKQAMAVFETVRVISGDDTARTRFIAQYTPLYHRSLNLYTHENLMVEAFLVSEQGRARSFNDALATGYIQLSDKEISQLIAEELSHYQTFIVTQNKLSYERAHTSPDPTLVAKLETQLEQAKMSHAATLDAIEARDDQLAALVPNRKAVITLPETQDLLDGQSTLVSFWILEERAIAFILTNGSFDIVSIDVIEEELNRQVKAFHDFAEIDSAHPDAAKTLHNTLITPLLPHLNTPHLIIVPHQALHYVPFAALTDGENYLMDDFAITYLPNASMLKFLPDADAPTSYENALVVGNPVVGEADEFDAPLLNLSSAEQSAQTIASLFGTTPLLTSEATETTVRQQVSTANILHLGAHGRYNTVAPMQSAIYLTPGGDEADVENNGRLRVQEVYSLPLDNIELVVLSACQTNLGYLDRANPLNNISAGDEIVSLNRAFLFQAPTVIASLWTVDDAATSLLMEHFYTYLLDGKSKADALRLAQLDVREQYPNPFFWAGFTLSGDGGAVDESLLSVEEAMTTTASTPEAVSVAETAVSSATTQPSNLPNTTPDPFPIIWLLPIAILISIGIIFVIRKR